MTSFPSTDTKKNLKNVGAINSDGTLNTALIRNKIGEDFAADARYLAEDGMKKRAVHMSTFVSSHAIIANVSLVLCICVHTIVITIIRHCVDLLYFIHHNLFPEYIYASVHR